MMILKFLLPDQRMDTTLAIGSSSTSISAISPSRRFAAAQQLGRFSNRPFEVKHFQTIRHCNVDVAHGLALLFGIGTRALPSWDP
ncbi:MAG TPA: hypothetical protein VNX23_24555, partial [Bradyrhizobium sp.]|uniref:hypothetical protein n=1 Tax=Bradyrhizobium sp. TaxID=376 RepID=UPI002BA2E196